MNRALGFTLLEMLIGLALLGLMLSLLFAGFRLASTSWDAAEATLEATSKEVLSRAAIRRILSEIRGVRLTHVAQQPIAFVGQSRRLVAVTTGVSAVGGLWITELTLATNLSSGRTQLLFRQNPFRYKSESLEELVELRGEPRVLLDGLDDAEFLYFGSIERGQPPMWADRWPNPDELPAAVRLSVKSSAGSWPQIVVQPRAPGGGKCLPSFSGNLRCN